MCESCGCGEKSFNDKVAEVIESIRPMLQNDGGDIELLGADEDNTVRVRLKIDIEPEKFAALFLSNKKVKIIFED